ncbi:MAG: hypothetical protein JST00_17210 [Deltaproteobacteria bacterium]|nr:hypothetical protein [Deltaproteobacteria bacterium]
MAAKRGKRAARAGRDAGARAQCVVLERIESQLQLVVEAVTMSREENKRDLVALEARLSGRIDVLESAVRQNSADIKQNSADIRQNSADIRQNSADIRQNTADIKQNSDDIRLMREEIVGLRRDFERRPELDRMAAVEERVSGVEAKVGAIR